jgi:hypothetical protein
LHVAIGKHHRVHRSGRRAGDAIDAKPWLFQQPIENAPSESSVRTSTLQREINENGVAIHQGRISMTVHMDLRVLHVRLIRLYELKLP